MNDNNLWQVVGVWGIPQDAVGIDKKKSTKGDPFFFDQHTVFTGNLHAFIGNKR